MAGYVIGNSKSKPSMANRDEKFGVNNITGIYTGTVVSNQDSLYTGRINVRIPEFGSPAADEPDTGTICLLMTPYGGIQSINESTQNFREYNESPKSYGMWPQPPEVGTQVVVGFTPAMEQGILLGSLIAKDRNHMMGGNASSFSYKNTTTDEQLVTPASEKNPFDTVDPDTRPVDRIATQTLIDQGLQEDLMRGHSQSSARRESPSKVFGISTLGGHTLVLDDGDSEGISKNIRIKTRGGAQILMDDTTGTVFINNHLASAYIEMDPDGRIDIYSQKEISVHTEGDYNVHAEGFINMQADLGVNIKSTGEGIKLQSTVGDINIHSASNLNLQADANGNLLCAGNYTETAGRIDMNGPPATPATDPIVNELSQNTGVTESISTRVPEHHPWKGATGQYEKFSTGEGNK
jgi:hypothetical protein